MNICMIVHNNATRDGRVMREAHTLRAVGHAVTVVGVPESGVTALEETLTDGVMIIRVPWQERVYRRRRILSVLRLIPCAAALACWPFLTSTTPRPSLVSIRSLLSPLTPW